MEDQADDSSPVVFLNEIDPNSWVKERNEEDALIKIEIKGCNEWKTKTNYDLVMIRQKIAEKSYFRTAEKIFCADTVPLVFLSLRKPD